MEILPLHKHTEFTERCAEILNAEWPRSQAARIHGLSKSCDQLPVSLVLVKRNNDGDSTEVKGYSKVSAVQGKKNSCLVESVIIQLEDRGRGLGRILMDLTEEHARKLGMQTVYLNTLDKEGFYNKLGYVRCGPVTSLGDNAHRVPESMLRHFEGLLSVTPDESIKSSINGMKNCVQSSTSSVRAGDTSSDMESSPPHQPLSPSAAPLPSAPQNPPSTVPPPPPPPPSSTVPPPPPPPPPSSTVPPPPPPPPPSSAVPPPPPQNPKTLSQYNKAVMRMDPNSVIWMKKEL